MRKLAFLPGQSILHLLHPLSKFVWLILITVFIFIIKDGLLIFAIAGWCLIYIFAVYPQIWKIRGFKFALITGMVLFILYVLFDKTGRILFDPGFSLLRLTSGGFFNGILYSGRFLTIVTVSYLFVLTTDPTDLAYSLMRIGVPYRVGFMLVTALRLSPLLEDEGRTIYQAQLVRGVRYDEGNVRQFILVIRQFMTPLLISAIRRADKLVFSMEGRGFGQYKNRTFRQKPKFKGWDIFFNLIMTTITAVVLILNSLEGI
jgi:energy-coupling factor transport system permease protein